MCRWATFSQVWETHPLLSVHIARFTKWSKIISLTFPSFDKDVLDMVLRSPMLMVRLLSTLSQWPRPLIDVVPHCMFCREAIKILRHCGNIWYLNKQGHTCTCHSNSFSILMANHYWVLVSADNFCGDEHFMNVFFWPAKSQEGCR